MKGLVLITLLIAGPLVTAGEALDPAKMRVATELVRLTRADELFRTMSLNSSREMLADKRITAGQLQCFEAVKLDEFTRRLAAIFARGLHFEEIQSAVDFYSSPTGMKFQYMAYQYNWEQNRKEFPLKIEGPKQSMKFAEIAELARFRESAGGLRLAHPLAYLNGPEALAEMGGFYLETRVVCEGIK